MDLESDNIKKYINAIGQNRIKNVTLEIGRDTGFMINRETMLEKKFNGVGSVKARKIKKSKGNKV